MTRHELINSLCYYDLHDIKYFFLIQGILIKICTLLLFISNSLFGIIYFIGVVNILEVSNSTNFGEIKAINLLDAVINLGIFND